MYLCKANLQTGKYHPTILTEDKILLGNGLAEINYVNGKHIIHCYYGVYVQGILKTGTSIELKHGQVITLENGEVYIVKDSLSIDSSKPEIERQHTPEEIERLQQEAWREFSNYNFDSLKKVASRLTHFMHVRYNFERRIFLVIKQNKGVALIAHCPEKEYRIPKYIICKAYKEKNTILFNYAEETTSSRSILENNISYAFCTPFMYEKHIVAMLYLDSRKQIEEHVYSCVQHICKQITPTIVKFFTPKPPQLKEIKL